ncbi:MAG: glycosyltransferase family 2 protein [Oscillospiraceae bacterium]|nr:glycosyltransferase family 2 protein [Oscillospiraceae bacterium]
MDRLYLVVPCYNEEEVLPETVRRLTDKLHRMCQKGLVSEDSRILLVDDGSRDRTWELICRFHEENPVVSGLKLSRNRGHQNALVAGLMTAKELCDITISLDADLQDDIEVIDQFVEEYHKGAQVVYGVRSARDTDTVFKRSTAMGFYGLMQKMGVDIVNNHADYRLMSKKALECFSGYREVNLFLRGIVPLIGFKTAVVTYERAERFAGESKYPLKKMLSFAWDGITSFSTKPLSLITVLGVLIGAVSGVGLLAAIITLLCGGFVGEWVWIVLSVWLALAIHLVALGLVGAYVGKTYAEVKGRPRYHIEMLLDEPKAE